MISLISKNSGSKAPPSWKRSICIRDKGCKEMAPDRPRGGKNLPQEIGWDTTHLMYSCALLAFTLNRYKGEDIYWGGGLRKLYNPMITF